MHFFIDESGHTGANLFDSNQPVLYYGVLSSESDIDKEAKNEILSLREKFNVQRLHANELGIGRILSQIDEIKEIKNNYKINFKKIQVNEDKHVKKGKVNPKRMQREIRKVIEHKGIGTKAQIAIKKQHEEIKIESKKRSREDKEAEQKRIFEIRKNKRKEKHKGH